MGRGSVKIAQAPHLTAQDRAISILTRMSPRRQRSVEILGLEREKYHELE